MALTINFPLVTRVFPQTVGHQIVSVQPMAMPSGYLPFFLNPIQDIEYLLNKKLALIRKMNDFYYSLDNNLTYNKFGSRTRFRVKIIESNIEELVEEMEKLDKVIEVTKLNTI